MMAIEKKYSYRLFVTAEMANEIEELRLKICPIADTSAGILSQVQRKEQKTENPYKIRRLWQLQPSNAKDSNPP